MASRSPVAPSAESLRELTAVALALKLVGRDTRNQINKSTRETLNPLWRQIIGVMAGSNKMDQLILVKGARIKAGNPSAAQAGTSTRALSAGGKPVDLARGREFGTPERGRYTTYKRGGKAAATVKRRTSAQLPVIQRKGRVVYPAFAEIGPRMVSLWVQIVVRRIHEAFEGK